MRKLALVALLSFIGTPLLQAEQSHPLTGLKSGEKIQFKLGHLTLFGKTFGDFLPTTRRRNFYLQFSYCVWLPEAKWSTNYTKKRCQFLERTKYWTLSAPSTSSSWNATVAGAEWEFAKAPGWTFSAETLLSAAQKLNPDGDFPSAIQVELRNDKLLSKLFGVVHGTGYLDLPARDHWNVNYGLFTPVYETKGVSVSGNKHAAAFLWASLLDEQGKDVRP